MNVRRPPAHDERGALLVHVALAMLTLIAFSALAIDYGALLGARRQSQNAADAAALAGAWSLAFDDPDDIPRAQAAAAATGQLNVVLGAAPSIVAATDVTLIPCPPGAPGVPDTCIRANVYRSAARSNALPTFFAQILGINSQDVRATATAQVETGNAVECLKPWAVADRWHEHWESGAPNAGPWTTTSAFDKYVKNGNNYNPDPSVTIPDVYVAPTAASPGTGFTPFDATGKPSSDYGLQMNLKLGSGENRISSGWFLALDLPCPQGGGGDCYEDNIKACTPNIFAVGETVPVSSAQGVKQGPTTHGVDGGGDAIMGLKERDPGAYWDAATQTVKGSCAPGVCADGKYYSKSPRVVAVALFDIDAFFAGSPSGKSTVPITNVMGFFIEGMGGSGNKDVIGRLVAIPGVTKAGGTVTETASFLRTVLLVR